MAAAPLYLAAILIDLIWACFWTHLEADADADDIAWKTAAISASQLNAQRADHLLASSNPSVN